MKKSWLSATARLIGFAPIKGIAISLCLILLSGCIPPQGMPSMESHYTTFHADYYLSLSKVERPEKASERYGVSKIDTLANDPKYKFYFEDDLVRIAWFVNSRRISLALQNKTDHSIKIPWDEAAYVDTAGKSHRVMHSGIKYTDREQSMPPSVVVRKGLIEDIIFPTDYVYWRDGTSYSSGRWEEKSFFPDFDFHGTTEYFKGDFATINDFEQAVRSYQDKAIQILLPLQIEDVINDYIFSFRIDSTSSYQEVKSTKYP